LPDHKGVVALGARRSFRPLTILRLMEGGIAPAPDHLGDADGGWNFGPRLLGLRGLVGAAKAPATGEAVPRAAGEGQRRPNGRNRRQKPSESPHRTPSIGRPPEAGRGRICAPTGYTPCILPRTHG